MCKKVHLLWHIIYSWKTIVNWDRHDCVPWDIAKSDLFFFSSDESASERASVLATPPANAFCKFAIAMASHGHGSRASAFWTQWTEPVKYPIKCVAQNHPCNDWYQNC